MAKKNPLHLDLTESIKTIQSLPITKINQFDNILSDISNLSYDAYEYILELPEKIKSLKPSKIPTLINDLNELKKQVTPLLDILCDMDYRSKCMYRVKEHLGTIEDKIPDLLKSLEKGLNP